MTEEEKDKFFNENYLFFKALIQKRKTRWRATSIMEFEDLESVLLTHLYRKLHLYDQTRPLDKWANTVITNQELNILRDGIYRDARPCISGIAPGFSQGRTSYGCACTHNRGDTACSWTKSGEQDSTCQFYKAWLDKKKAKSDIAAPLSLESHVDEHHNKPSDFIDYDRHKAAIDKIMVKKLTKSDAKIYRLIYIRHWPMPRVLKELNIKGSKVNKTPILITKARNRFIKMAREIMSGMDFQ